MENPLKKKIEKNIEKSKAFPQFYQYNFRIYFLNSYGVIVSLPSKEFLQKLDSLKRYFEDRPEPEKKKLIRENLSMFAKQIPEREYNKKVELVYDSAFVQVYKISNYPPSEDYTSPNIRELMSLRGEKLTEESESNLWNTAYERTRWLTDFAIKVRDKLRKELLGD